MRILVVSQYFWPEGFRINAIAESLVERGIEVEILTGKPNYPEGNISTGYHAWGCQREQWQGATLHRVPLFPRGRNSHIRLLLNYLSFIFFGLICGSWMVRKRHYDVIFVNGLSPIMSAIPALFIGWLKGKKVIIWVQDLWPESLSATGYIRNRFIIGVVRQVVRCIYRHADLLLVQSKAFEEPVRALAMDTPIVYYPNSVDNAFAVPAKVESPKIPGLGDGFSVMFAGNIGSAQAVDVIVDAAALLKEYKEIQFVVLGEGSCREEMLQAARQRGLTNLHLPGRFPVETMPGFMQKASALLVTLADRPIFAATVPNKVQAYLAAGRPIIACLNGEGARLVAEAGAGLASPAEDGKALADTVLHLYRMPEGERERMGANGRHYYHEHFDHNHLIDELIGHFQAVSQDLRIDDDLVRRDLGWKPGYSMQKGLHMTAAGDMQRKHLFGELPMPKRSGTAATCDVSVVIVNYNARDILLRCVAQATLQAEQVIVVDNASQDGSVAALREAFSAVTVIANNRNLGFATACNQGAMAAAGDHILFLNPDCILETGAVKRLVEAVHSAPDVGMVGGLLINPDGSEQAGGRRAVPTPWRSFVRVSGLGGLSGRYPSLFSDFSLHKQPLPQKPIIVEAISGACMLVHREALEQVGLLDEGYFMHCEDLDWCMRFRRSGWTLLFVPDARMIHHKGYCSKSRPIFVEWNKHRGMLRFYNKFFRHQYPGLLMVLVNIGVGMRFMAVTALHLFKRMKRLARTRRG